MRILRRYIGREIYFATGLVILALLSLFIVFDFINELQDVGKTAYRAIQAVAVVLLSVPGHVYELFPIAALVGTVVAVSQLSAHSELAVMRSSGVSLGRLAGVVIQAGLVLAVLAVIVGEVVVPYSDRGAQRLRLKATSDVVAQEFRSGLWVKDEGSFVNVRRVGLDSSLTGVRIFQFDPGFRLRSLSVAEHGEYLGGNRWRLTGLTRTEFGDEGSRVVRLAQEEWHSVLNPNILSVLLVDPQKMTLVTLSSYIEHLRGNRQQATRYEIAFWRKLLYPFTVLVMMALAVPFAQHERRTGGVGARIFAAIMVGLAFFLLNRLVGYLGLLNEWPPLLTAAAPSAIFLMAAFGAIWWVERR
jgi:lipopolysaccharide export system permease protein